MMLAVVAAMLATPVSAAPPSGPINLVTEVIERQVHLTWEAPTSGDRAVGYNVFHKLAGTTWGNHFSRYVGNNQNPALLFWDFPDLTQGRTYEFRVQAFADQDGDNLVELGGISSTVRATIPANDSSDPGNVISNPGSTLTFTGVGASQSSEDWIRLAWDTPPPTTDDGGIVGTLIYRLDQDGPVDHYYRIYERKGSRLTGFTDNGVEPGHLYSYYVIPMVVVDWDTWPRGGYVWGTATIVLARTLADSRVPQLQAPTGVTATVRNVRNVSVAWTRGIDETPGYIVQWRESNQSYTDGVETYRLVTQTFTRGEVTRKYYLNRTAISAREQRQREEIEGFATTVLRLANPSRYVRQLGYGTRYYFRVGVCAAVLGSPGGRSCDLDTVLWAPEISTRTGGNR